MSGAVNAFSPLGASVAVTAPSGSSSSSTALPGAGGCAAQVYNASSAPVTIAFSTTSGGATATATTELISPSLTRVVSMPYNSSDVAVYGIGGSGTVYIQRGDGI